MHNDEKIFSECRNYIRELALGLYRNELHASNEDIQQLCELIRNIYCDILDNMTVEYKKNTGKNADVLIQQFNNFTQSIGSGDYIELADTLLYEINNALEFYIEEKEKFNEKVR